VTFFVGLIRRYHLPCAFSITCRILDIKSYCVVRDFLVRMHDKLCPSVVFFCVNVNHYFTLGPESTAVA
jgi:hypothetical protein